MRLRQRVDLRYTNLSSELRLVEFAELDEGVNFSGTLPDGKYCIYYRVEAMGSQITDYSGCGLNPNALRHLDWLECK